MSSRPDTFGVSPEQLAELRDYFRPADLEWRIGPTNADKTKGMALCYLTARAVMDRLDEVCGPENWRDEYRPTPNDPDGTSLLCGISILLQRPDGSAEWVTKWDGASNTDTEAVKGGLSASMKRAAVKWGIGRYLYEMPSPWVAIQKDGRTVRIIESPRVPREYLPEGMEDSGVEARTSPDPRDAGGPPAKDMTPEQKAQIEELLAHPAMTEEARKAYVAWLRKKQSRIMADRAISRIQEIIVEQGGVLDDAAIGGDGADHQIAA